MGSSHPWDDKSIKTKIKYFQQNSKLVDIMDKMLEKYKEHYILTLAQQGAKLLSNFDVTNEKWDEAKSPSDIITLKL